MPSPQTLTELSNPTREKVERRKVASATLVGTTIEWFDFFIYAQAAGLIFAKEFFAAASEFAQIVSWVSLGISFLFRPVGAAVAGHLGDKYGRKPVLTLTLIVMGVATALIGVLPTAAQIGVAAPILLLLLRIVQGLSAGGEWGGAALMAVEHAPRGARGKAGAYPQLGAPCGLALATIVSLVLNVSLGHEAYIAWGWRIPFLLSLLLVGVGLWIRSRVEESPVYREIEQESKAESAPLKTVMRTNGGTVLLAALIFAANNAAGYMLIAFFGSYGIKTLGLDSTPVLASLAAAAILWAALTLWSGALSDKLGRIETFLVGYALLFVAVIPTWRLVNTAELPLFFLGVVLMTPGLALSYGPQSALYAEMFPRPIRFSGVSISYALGAILGGAFAPMIAEFTLGEGSVITLPGYLMGMTAIAVAALLWVRKRVPLQAEL